MTHDLRRAAEKRVKARLGFYIHATVFVFVNAMQFGINLFTTPWIFWSVFPALGWGLGLAIHGLVVWFKTSDLRERMIEDELEGLDPLLIRRDPKPGIVINEDHQPRLLERKDRA